MDDLDRVSNFFYSCLTARKPRVDGREWKLFWWATKYWSAQLYFLLYRKYCSFWSWATQYYPFSLLFQDRLFHHKNRPIDDLMTRFEYILKKEGLKTKIYSGMHSEPLSEFYGTFVNQSDFNSVMLEKIEELLKSKYEDIYVRPHEHGFKVLISTDILRTKYLMK